MFSPEKKHLETCTPMAQWFVLDPGYRCSPKYTLCTNATSNNVTLSATNGSEELFQSVYSFLLTCFLNSVVVVIWGKQQ